MSSYINRRLRSFKYAFEGLTILFTGSPNALIHLVMAIIAIIMGFWLSISIMEWVAIIIVIGLVIALEGVNSSIEELANHVCMEENYSIKKVKDLAAGAVLISAMAALAVGLIIFAPKILSLFV